MCEGGRPRAREGGAGARAGAGAGAYALEDVDRAAVAGADEALRLDDDAVERVAVHGRLQQRRRLALELLDQQQLPCLCADDDSVLCHPGVTDLRGPPSRPALARSALLLLLLFVGVCGGDVYN
jgi:hypothetical protein